MNRLIECAKCYNAKKIELTACASDGIEQEDLEELYQKCGFRKISRNGNTMIYELEK